MNYGVKMPVMTKEDYEDAAEYYDIYSETTTEPTKDEMIKILEALGYDEEVKEAEKWRQET